MNLSKENILDFMEAYREITDLGVNQHISEEENKNAVEEYNKRIEENSSKWKYFCSYAVYNAEGELKIIDSGIFYVDNEVSTQSDMYFLDYTVTGFVKPEDGSFIKLISWHCLGKPNGTV